MAGAGGSVAWTGGTPELLADGEEAPQGITTDADTIYWTTGGKTYGAGAVRKRAKAGGPTTTVADSQHLPGDIVVDVDAIYWIQRASGEADGAVMRSLKSGGPAVVLLGGLSLPYSVAVDGDYVYASHGDCGLTTVVRLPKQGGDAEALASGQCYAESLMLTATDVFWVGQGVRYAPLEPGAVGTLASPEIQGIKATLADKDIFWSEQQGSIGIIHQVSIADGSESTFAKGELVPTVLGADASWVYWVTVGDTTAFRAAPRGGGAPVTVMPLDSYSLAFAVDTDAIYLAEEGPPGRIWKIPK